MEVARLQSRSEAASAAAQELEARAQTSAAASASATASAQQAQRDAHVKVRHACLHSMILDSIDGPLMTPGPFSAGSWFVMPR